MRKRTASGKSTSCWRLSFWRFSIGFRIITALFHKKKQPKGCFFLVIGENKFLLACRHTQRLPCARGNEVAAR